MSDAIPVVADRVQDIEADTPIEVIADGYTKLESFLRIAKQHMDDFKGQMEQWILANKKNIEWVIDGDGNKMVFYLDENKTIKCMNLKLGVSTLLEHGSIEELEECLSSNAFKHGAYKKFLIRIGKPEIYDAIFATVVTKKIKGEAPKKVLQSFDTSRTRYIK